MSKSNTSLRNSTRQADPRSFSAGQLLRPWSQVRSELARRTGQRLSRRSLHRIRLSAVRKIKQALGTLAEVPS